MKVQMRARAEQLKQLCGKAAGVALGNKLECLEQECRTYLSTAFTGHIK